MSVLSKSASSEPPSLKATVWLSAGGVWGSGSQRLEGCSTWAGLLEFFSISAVSQGFAAISPDAQISVSERSDRVNSSHLCNDGYAIQAFNHSRYIDAKCHTYHLKKSNSYPIFMSLMKFWKKKFKIHFCVKILKCRDMHSRSIFFLRRGQTTNQTTRAVTRAQPSEMHSVPHHGTLSKPSTRHTKEGHETSSEEPEKSHVFFNSFINVKFFLWK